MALRRIRRRAIPVDQVDLGRVQSLAKELGLRRTPKVWLSPEVKAPAVCGVLRPMLLLNDRFFQMLSREEADFVLRHELIHIRRGDVLLSNVLFGLLSIHWFNPLLWYAFARAKADREAACDEDVLQAESPARRVAYGKTLLRMEAALPEQGLCLGFVGMVQRGKRLRERIQFISNPKRMGLSMKSLVLLCMCVTAILGIAKSAEPKSKPKLESTFATDERPTEESKSETQKQQPLKFRKVASLKSPGADLALARTAVSLDHKSVIARVLANERQVGTNDQVRFSRYDVVLQNLNPKSPKRKALGHPYFGFVPRSNLAFAVHWRSGVRFWNTVTHEPSGGYMPHELREDTTILPAVSPDGKVMVTRSQLDHLQFWNIETRKAITKEIKQRGLVSSMRFSADGKWFFSQTGRRLSIRNSHTGDLLVGDIRHEVSSLGYCADAKRLITVELSRDGKDGWRRELVIRGGETFAEQRRIALDEQVKNVAWIDPSHFVVVGTKPDLPPSSYERETLYLVTLSDEKADVRSLLQYNWIREVVVAPNRQHFVARTQEQTSCWKLGGEEPVWTKPGDHLVSFGDRDWVLFHKGPLVVYSLADGSELWRRDDVRLCKVFGSKIWTCNDQNMEIWHVEPDSAPLKSSSSAGQASERKSNEDQKAPQAVATNAKMISISTVGPRAELQTDADIVRYKGQFYIAFAKPTRERQNAIHILQSVNGRNWESAKTLHSETEERRPDVTHSTHYSGLPVWFSTMPSGRLCLTGRASEKTIVWSTDDGADWREELDINLSRSYSRIHWQNDRAYCVSDESSSCGEKFEFFRLESADQGATPETVYKLSHNSHTLTGPRESQLVLTKDEAFCLLSFETYNIDKVRRWLIPSGKYAKGKLGVSKAPYTEWTWTPTALKFGHPNLLVLQDKRIISTVFIDGDDAHNAFCQLDPSTGKLIELLRFPIPATRQPIGMTEHDGHIWACYYDGPQDRKNPPTLKVAKIALGVTQSVRTAKPKTADGKANKPTNVAQDSGGDVNTLATPSQLRADDESAPAAPKETGEEAAEVIELKQHTAPVHTIQWSADGKRLATACESGLICIWDAAGKLSSKTQVEAVKHPIYSFTPDLKRVAVVRSRDSLSRFPAERNGGETAVYSLPDGKKICRFNARTESIRDYPFSASIFAVELSPDGTKLAVGGSLEAVGGRHGEPGGIATIWDVETAQIIRRSTEFSTTVTSLGWTGDSDVLVIGTAGSGSELAEAGEIHTWHKNNWLPSRGTPVRIFHKDFLALLPVGKPGYADLVGVRDIQVVGDQLTALIQNANSEIVRKWNVVTGKSQSASTTEINWRSKLQLELSSHGALVAAHREDTAHVYNAATLKRISMVKVPSAVRSVGFDSQDTKVAIGTDTGIVQIHAVTN